LVDLLATLGGNAFASPAQARVDQERLLSLVD